MNRSFEHNFYKTKGGDVMYSDDKGKDEDIYKEIFWRQQNSKRDSKHHIVPRSRGGNGQQNNVKINEELHQKYHDLFLNRTPEEILEFLTEYFWGGDIESVKNFLEQKEEQYSELVSNCR